MAARNKENMMGGHRINVRERHHIVVLVDELTRNTPIGNLTEQAIFHKNLSPIFLVLCLCRGLFARAGCRYHLDALDFHPRQLFSSLICAGFHRRGSRLCSLCSLFCLSGFTRLSFDLFKLGGMQFWIIVGRQIHLCADGFDSLVDDTGLQIQFIGDLAVNPDGWDRKIRLVGAFNLRLLLLVALVGLGLPPARNVLAFAQCLDDLFDRFLGYREFVGNLAANAIELGGHGQFQVARLDLGDLLRCRLERLWRWNPFLLRFWWGRRFWLFLASRWLAGAFFAHVVFVHAGARTPHRRAGFAWLARAMANSADDAPTQRGVAIGAWPAIAAGTRGPLIAIGTRCPGARSAVWLAWCRGGRQPGPLRGRLRLAHFDVVDSIEPVA